MKPTRPALRYMGGKWVLAPWIIGHFPPHRTYVEPFGGGASVLLRKQRAYAEVYNDLADDVVVMFEVLRDPELAPRLIELVALTPFSRREFERSYERSDDPVEHSRRLIVRSFMGHGSTAVSMARKTGFRADSNRAGTTPPMDWAALPRGLAQVAERMAGVVIEHRPAADIMARFDGHTTLVYADPPYLHSTRSKKRIHGDIEHRYEYEMDEAGHEELLDQLLGLESMVVLSAYHSELYDRKLTGWTRRERKSYADSAKPRVEVLWLNPQAAIANGLFMP